MHSRNLPCFTWIPSKLADSEKSSKAAFREHYATITIASCSGNSVKDEVGGRLESLTLWGVFHSTSNAPSFISVIVPLIRSVQSQIESLFLSSNTLVFNLRDHSFQRLPTCAM